MKSNNENLLVQKLAKLKGKLQKDLQTTKPSDIEKIQHLWATLNSVNESFVLAIKLLNQSNNRGL